jgi:hypothetical protein
VGIVMNGWQCPGCGRCYAPHVPECFDCNGHRGPQRPVEPRLPMRRANPLPAPTNGSSGLTETKAGPLYPGDMAEMAVDASPVLREWAEHEASVRRLTSELQFHADRVTGWES